MHSAYDLKTWLDLANGQFATALLVFARFGGLFFAAPMISGKNVPNSIRIGLAVVLAAIMGAILPPVIVVSYPAMAAGLAKEVLLGLVLGWVTSLVFAGAQMAGEWLDMQGGFQAGHILNPAFETNNAPIGNLKYLMAGIVFLWVGGIGMMIRGAAASFEISPPGTYDLHVGAISSWMGMISRGMWVALEIAAPVGVALLLAELAIGIMSRAVPQVNMMLLTMPGKALLAVAGVAVCIPVLAQVLNAVCTNVESELMNALRIMGS